MTILQKIIILNDFKTEQNLFRLIQLSHNLNQEKILPMKKQTQKNWQILFNKALIGNKNTDPISKIGQLAQRNYTKKLFAGSPPSVINIIMNRKIKILFQKITSRPFFIKNIRSTTLMKRKILSELLQKFKNSSINNIAFCPMKKSNS